MSPQDVQQVLPVTDAPRFYPVYPIQFHPEFGYLAPTIRFRRKASLIVKGTAFGVLVGAALAIAMLPDPETRVGAALSIQTHATPADDWRPEPVAFVAPTLALPAAARGTPVLPSAERNAAAPQAAPVAAPVASIAATATEEAKVPPRPRRKTARPSQRPRAARASEPDPRNAYAGPFRGASGEARRSFERPFGFGW